MWFGRRLRSTWNWLARQSRWTLFALLLVILISPCLISCTGLLIRKAYINAFVFTAEDHAFFDSQREGKYEEGVPSAARKLIAEFEPFNDPNSAVADHPDWFAHRFPNGEWVFGHGINSHGLTVGQGTMVVKDSSGKTRVFFGHVCGENMGFPWGLEHCKGLDDFYKRLVERPALEWFP